MNNPELEEKRKSFHAHLIKELRNTPPSDNFYLRVFSTIVKIGLQRKAKEIKLFEDEEWNNIENREELLKKVRNFLDRNIK